MTLGRGDPGAQMRLEYRAADATANPYMALGAILHAGLAGVRGDLPAPALLLVDPATLEGEEQERFGGRPADIAGGGPRCARRRRARRGRFPPLLLEAYTALKRGELEMVADLDLAERCRLYGNAY